MPEEVVIAPAEADFSDWEHVLSLLHAAFDYQKDRIDPPSSLYRLDRDSLARKAADEHLILARIGGELAGCVFVQARGQVLYLGKLAVWPHLQGRRIGALLLEAVERFAAQQGATVLELETRVELTENHETFARLGFTRVSEHAHAGYDRPTYVRMQKPLRV